MIINIEPMSVNIRRQLIDLRSLIVTLEERCTALKTQNTDLRNLIAEQRKQIEGLEILNRQLETKYRNLQIGVSAGHSPKEVTTIKNRFMAMVREIDDCIAKLGG